MSKLRGVDGMTPIGSSVLALEPVFIGGVDCSGNAKGLPICDSTPKEGSDAVTISPRPVSVFNDSFSAVRNEINTQWDLISQGAGQTIAQAGGNLVLGSGVTPGEEIIIRTKVSWRDAFVLRYLITNSSYQANAKTTVEMVDVLGDNLGVTSNGTDVSITNITEHGFNAENIGQSVFIGAFKNLVGGAIVPGQWAIASITNVNTFVVTATGSTGTVTSGTCSVWGYNSFRVTYGATSASTAYLNSTRKGWNSAADTSASTSAIASGSYGVWSVNDGIFLFNETTNNSTGALNIRGGRSTGIPAADTELFLQIKLTVGQVAPTAMTSTISMVSVEDINVMPVEFTMGRGVNAGIISFPVTVTSIPTVTNSVATPSTSSNGISSFHLINSAATTNATSVKNASGVVTSISLFNGGATPAYFKLYNKSSAPTTADTPIKILAVGPGQSRDYVPVYTPRTGSGIAYVITGGAANNDATAVAVNQVVGGIDYV